MRLLLCSFLMLFYMAGWALSATLPRVLSPKYICGGQTRDGTFGIVLDHFSNMTSTVTPGSEGQPSQSLTISRVSYTGSLPTSYAPNSCSGAPCLPNLSDVNLPAALVGVDGALPVLQARGSSTAFTISGLDKKDATFLWSLGGNLERQNSISIVPCCSDMCHYFSPSQMGCLVYTSAPQVISMTLASEEDAIEWSVADGYDLYDVVFSYTDFPWFVQAEFNSITYGTRFAPLPMEGQTNVYVQHVELDAFVGMDNVGSRPFVLKVNCLSSPEFLF